MSTMLIAFNGTRENGNFMGDQLCALKAAYLFVENEPGVDRVILTMSPGNEMNFVWQKFIDTHHVEVIYDDWNPGDWDTRHTSWNRWRSDKRVRDWSDTGEVQFDHYRELYLRIHGSMRQHALCGHERGIGRRNIYEYWFYGQEHLPVDCAGSDWYDDTLCYHPPLTGERDVYVSPHCKTQGNVTFTFDYWARVVRNLLNAGVTVTVGYDQYFYDDEFCRHPLYRKHWGDHQQWFQEVCRHKLVACGNTGTGWVAAACGVPMITMEPHNSVMADHRYRECGLRNVKEVVDGYRLDEMNNDMGRVADYVAQKITEEVRRKVVMTTGCYDVLHAGHVRHLQRARRLGTRLIVALNSDESVKSLKGPTRPINRQDQRKAVLEELRCVDEVRIFDGPDALALIGEIKPDVLACGYGYAPETIVGRDMVEGWGGRAVVTCTGDASIEPQPSTTSIIQRVVRSRDVTEVCRLACAYSVNPFDKLRLMAGELLSVSHLEGDVADLGSYRGGSALVLRRLAPDRHLHCFDTWEGTPYDDELCHHKRGEWAASVENCKTLVGKEGVAYIKGVFPDLPNMRVVGDLDWFVDLTYTQTANRFCFVYCDMDTYQATKDAVEFFWPRLVSGGKMMFDDYGWEPCAGVKKAVDEAFPSVYTRAEDGISGRQYAWRVIQSQYACIVEKR